MPRRVKTPDLSIRQLRIQAGRTQQEVADLLGITLRAYNSWEKTPTRIPHGSYLQLVWWLEQAVQIRKETKMATYHEPVTKAVLVTDDEGDDEYTVDHPPFEFVPIDPKTGRRPTNEEMIRYESTGEEPFDGYADQLLEWERGWEIANRKQQEIDGGHAQEVKVVHPDPDYDEAGQSVDYDEAAVWEDTSTGDLYAKDPSDGTGEDTADGDETRED